MHPEHIYERRVDPNAGDSLAKISRLIRPGATLLELGPATGYFTRHLRENLNCTVDCLEYSAAMADQARPFARKMIVGDLDDPSWSTHFTQESYDYIVFADVLEHLKNPWAVLQAARSLLNHDGAILISIPNISHAGLVVELLRGQFRYCDEGLLDRTHLRFFTRSSLLAMLRETGYRVESLDQVHWMPESTEFNVRLDALDAGLRDELLRNPDVFTYQFILAARPGAMDEQAWAALDLAAAPVRPFFRAQLYFAAPGHGFSEDASIRRSGFLGVDAQRLEFPFPSDSAFQRLRFDPCDRPGYLRIRKLAILRLGIDGLNQQVWSAEGLAQIAAAVHFENIKPLASPLGETLLATSNDPQLLIQLPQHLRSTPESQLVFVAELDWPHSADYEIAMTAFNQLCARHADMEAALRRRIADLEWIVPAHAEAKAKLGGLENLARDQDRHIKNLEQILADINSSRSRQFVLGLGRIKTALANGARAILGRRPDPTSPARESKAP